VIVSGAELPGSGRTGPCGSGRLDVRFRSGRVAQVGEHLPPCPGETVIEAGGGALLPGLHDHHLHLLSLAAAMESVPCGPPAVRDRASLERSLRRAARSAPGHGLDSPWVRGVGYDESVAGALDRSVLDAIVCDRPVRVQHRSGQMWVLNSLGVARARLEAAGPPAVERDEHGSPSGRVFGADRWLRDRFGDGAPPDVAAAGRALARFGVTGVTDATPGNGEDELSLLASAVSEGTLPQRVLVMGGAGLDRLSRRACGRAEVGPLKVMLREWELPELDELASSIRLSHAARRAVAVHCTTAAELVLALGAFESAGAVEGDRIEHASVAPPPAIEQMRTLGLTVVTQPNFVWERGDDYIERVDPADLPHLYRCGELLRSGVPVGAGTDSPFGEPDPWVAVRAAVERRTRGGEILGGGERVSPERALGLFLAQPARPGGERRRLAPGALGDAVLLRLPWAAAREQLSSALVRATICGGRVAYLGE
jgi:predicted amidohydrolase YtcJ